MRKHTPGPWEVGYCTWNDDGNVCYELRGIRQGCAADARLIGAAPTLAKLGKAVVDCWKNPEDLGEEGLLKFQMAIDELADAIAKATGEKNGN